MIAGFGALTGIVSLDAVEKAIRDKFAGKVADANAFAARKAWEWVEERMAEPANA